MSATPYFAVGRRKLVIMSIATAGIYQFTWFYMHWKHQRAATGEDIHPFWRTFFAPVYCYALFRRLSDDAAKVAPDARFEALPWAAGWIFVTLICAFPQFWWLVFGLFAFSLPAQRAADAVNATIAPGHDPNDKIRGGSLAALLACVVLAAAFALLNWMIATLQI